ncbi:hypothetical protein GDO86_015106 [Hymenochirus boettgeri]|uniref:Uncharacterized protein n=1 Tax=Hymenochirus boettgeri TaxID=247094 RepID=A0A8T2JXD1_9PIPI|nr:hypothetical protein GDO86_015106 [Hymenochirus boettgeri]
MDHNCQHEAQCIPEYNGTNHSYTCVCHPGFIGEDCSTPTTFSFMSQGYIVYDLSRDTMNAEKYLAVRFRTLLDDMVLMYRGDQYNFLLVELYQGLLHTLLKTNGTLIHLVIDNVMANDGHWHRVEISLNSSLTVSLSHKECSNGLCVRKQYSTDGYDPLGSFNTVFIGGLVKEGLTANTQSKRNFTGCLEDLVIDYINQLPQNVGSNVSYAMELGCNKTEWCSPNPCNNNAQCVDRWSNFTCECKRPFRGPTCMQEYIPGTFFMEGVPSYAHFEVNKHLGATFSVSAFIRTLKSDGLLLQINNGTLPYFTIYLKNGWIHIRTLLDQSLVFKKNISNGKKNWIEILFKEGKVTVSDLNQKVELGLLPPVTVAEGYQVFVGGMAATYRTTFWGGYFKGCLQDVRINNDHLEFFPLEQEDITEEETLYPGNIISVMENCVSDDVCQQHPCQNEGKCTVTWNDFTCSCPDNFTGRICEEPLWCKRGPCSPDSDCVDVPKGYMCLVSASFHGHSSAIFRPNISTEPDLSFISLKLRTRDREAVLLQASKEVDSVLLAIRGGHFFIKLQSGNNVEEVELLGTVEIADALWHQIVLTRVDTSQMPFRWSLQIDDVNTSFIWDGGNLDFMRSNVSVILAENYTGCLDGVSIGGIYLPFTDHKFPQWDQFIKEKSHAMDLGCRGADVCGEGPCQHGGRCMDLFNSFNCACRVGWEGQRCEINIDDCKSKPCIHGSCMDLEADYQCNCMTGYTGRNCETNLDDCQHHECLNGGSCVDGVNSFTCTCPHSYAGPYCQWPYPPEQCDKNLTCSNGGRCDDGIWGANCTCKPGFSGRRCEINVNDCESNPCLNGGTCQDSVNNFKCICNSSFTGVRCEKSGVNSMFPFPLIGIAVPVTCGVLLLLVIGVIFMVLTARKRRQSEGTYSPSQQEVAGARLEMDSVLKVPPEERLI